MHPPFAGVDRKPDFWVPLRPGVLIPMRGVNALGRLRSPLPRPGVDMPMSGAGFPSRGVKLPLRFSAAAATVAAASQAAASKAGQGVAVPDVEPLACGVERFLPRLAVLSGVELPARGSSKFLNN